jgi:hypothetical protein
MDVDIFHTKIVTTACHEVFIRLQGRLVSFTDVGGQRSERRKWLHLFEESTHVVIFIAALDDYNLMLPEDPTQNRLMESFLLFKALIKLPQLGAHLISWSCSCSSQHHVDPLPQQDR